MEKKELRKRFNAQRESLSTDDHRDFSEKIMQRLCHTTEYQNAMTLASFVSFKSEVDTYALNEKIIRDGKTLVLPKIHAETKEMLFYKVDNLDTLVKSSYGIFEPSESIHKSVSFSDISLVITPGLAFDTKGFRLGYGGGFYDVFFKKLGSHVVKIAIGFDIQRAATLPVEKYDVPVDYLVTERNIYTY